MTDENPVVTGDDEFVDAVEDDQFDALEEDDEQAAPPQ